jgi:2-desacetyl-2-hydroxyethyl bacteriochlorophyllide A dehydrogenase
MPDPSSAPRPSAPAPSATAVWFAAPRTVELREESVGAPGPGTIRVAAVASAISHGSEMLVYRGQVASGTDLDLPTLSGTFSLPIKYGYASVGRVVEVGRDVDRFSTGDAVFALHPHQTSYVVSAALAWPLPAGLPLEDGLFAANLETALNALLDQPVRLGDRVVVLGQGVVGLLIGLLARRSGAGRVIGVDPYERRRSLALELGADEALAPGAGLVERLRHTTEGRGADLIFEASGSPAALQTAVDAVAVEGTVVACSWYGTKPVSLELGGHFHRGRVRVRSSQVGRLAPALAPRWDYERRRALVLDLLPTLPLASVISHRFPLDRAAEAYRLVDERPEETTQVILTYPEASEVD